MPGFRFQGAPGLLPSFQASFLGCRILQRGVPKVIGSVP